MSDRYNLHRFVEAQDQVLDDVRRELAEGCKRTHWMWFIFPQIAGLGLSPASRFYAISSLDEARAYLAHPVLGARLLECTEKVLAVQGRSAHDIFGAPDDMKFHSCMTLFARAGGAPFRRRWRAISTGKRTPPRDPICDHEPDAGGCMATSW